MLLELWSASVFRSSENPVFRSELAVNVRSFLQLEKFVDHIAGQHLYSI